MQNIIGKELAGLEPIAYQLFSRNIPYVAPVDLYPPLGFDPEKVRMLLADANWTLGPDGVRRNGKGEPLVGCCGRGRACPPALAARPLLLMLAAAAGSADNRRV